MASTTETKPAADTGSWPLEVRALFHALTRPAAIPEDRRSRPRAEFRAKAVLRIERQKQQTLEVEIYLRDYDDRAVSFVVCDVVPGDRNVELELTGADGGQRRIPCRVGRCRQFREGWFEGVLRMAR